MHCTSILSTFLQDGTNKFAEPWKGKGLAIVGISYNMKHVYNWMTMLSLRSSPISEDTRSPENCDIEKEQPSECVNGLTTRKFLSFGEKEDGTMNKNASMTSLYYNFHGDLRADYNFVHTSQLNAESCLNPLALGNCASQEREQKTQADGVVGEKMDQHKESILENGPKAEICPSLQDKPNYAFAKQEPDFAGALDGIFISLCLHPMDTFETGTQSCGAHQSSIIRTSRTNISDKGLKGLYRGISSNIASSTPISALYAYPYESIKRSIASSSR